ncbi:protein kinase C and casein kinase II substrate protein 3-like isoform X2 [Artemia franciscana]|uniref:protein kinase C and casein kinase II substrate protein 3-like isoform X2 n=1 Tax=Artemia franciscana TaxID=6661 RepID=UPI0032DB4094
MSHHSDDALLVSGSESFWEPSNYKRTTKRIEDGNRLCDDLIKLVNERAEIEKTYAKLLKGWSKKWQELIEKGPEYGTTEAAWKGVLVEADRLSDIHLRIRDGMANDVTHQVKTWQKETYHKSMTKLKEKKEMDDHFKKAQKPWLKLYEKVNKAKSDYHSACKGERSALNQERNATGDNSLSPENLKKLQDRVQRAKEDVQRNREKYESALRELNDYNPKYVEDMTDVFEKCQEMETHRLHFVKDLLFSVHKNINIASDPVLPQIYEELYHTIANADAEKDLRWWSNNHGANMGMNWPSFEPSDENQIAALVLSTKSWTNEAFQKIVSAKTEYSEEFRDISGKGKKGHLPEGAITLINQRSVSDDLPELSSFNDKKKAVKKSSNANSLRHNEINIGKTEAASKISSDISSSLSNGKKEEAPFDEESEDWDPDLLVDNGEPGVPVRALYDYEGAEFDELSFKRGEVFEKLEDEDEQGWCKGRKDGRVGLYPANYVEPV